MNQPIEQTLRPETINEILLIERINELHRKAYLSVGPASPFSRDLSQDVQELPYLERTLHLAGSFEAGVEQPHGNLKISARTFGPISFGLGQYVTAQQLQQMQPWDEVRLFDHIWRDGMHKMTKEVRRIQENQQAR